MKNTASLTSLFIFQLLFGCGPSESAYDAVKNNRLTFLMAGTFQLKDETYQDYQEDGQRGWYAGIEKDFCLKVKYKGKTYYAAVTVLNGGGTGYNYGVMVFKDGQTVASLGLGDRIKVKSLSYSQGKIQVEYYVHQKEEKLSDLPTLLVQDELLLDYACKDGTEYKRLNLKNPDELHIMSPPQVSDKLQ